MHDEAERMQCEGRSSARMPGLNTQGSHAEAFLDRPGFDRPPENENALHMVKLNDIMHEAHSYLFQISSFMMSG